jgi:serine/threonine protein kinase
MTIPAADFAARARALAPDFELQREIGRGGMGIVYLALDVRLDREVAVKVLPEYIADVAAVRERFLREARTAARLSHANIVPIYRADELHGVVFFVMAYVDGESLAERLAGGSAVPWLEGAHLLRDVAVALDYAHARGIVHRDVKPENILIERGTGHALVYDFGIARLAEASPLTATGQVLGTVHYMSPEQVNGEPLDGRSDLYSLGVVGFRALTGRLPFDSETASAVLVAHVTKQPPKVRDVAPGIPGAIAAVIDRCLEKDAAARYQTGGDLARALDDAVRESAKDPVTAAPQVISEGEAQAVWTRAAELQADTGIQHRVAAPTAPAVPPSLVPSASDQRRTLTSGYRMTDVKAAAEEAGISGRYVERAAAELGLASPAATAGLGTGVVVTNRSPPPSRWLGGALNIAYEVQVPGEAPDRDFDILIEIIRRQMGEVGTVSTIGRSLSWSTTSKYRQVSVSVVPRNGRTTIRVDERLTNLAGGLFGGIVGGAGGGSAGAAMGVGFGALHSALAAFGMWGVGIAGSYFLARSIFSSQRQSRERQLGTLVDQLSEQIGESIRVLLPRR